MLIAQLSDLHITAPETHLYGLVDTAQFLQRAIAHLNRLDPQPDLVLITGDLVDQGTEVEYRHLRDLLAPLRAPLYLALGNHDDRDSFRQVWGHCPYVPPSGPLNYCLEAYPVRLMVLDTLVPGASHGLVDDGQRQWLAQTLGADPQRPTVIALHHPPFATGLPGMDGIRCQGAETLAEVIQSFPTVERVLCGHLHRAIQVRWAGTLGSVAPSVAHQVKLTLHPEVGNAFIFEPPAFQLHLWHPDQGLITHTVPIGDFPAYSYRTKERLPAG